MARYRFVISPSVSLVLASALWGIATVISKALLASVPPITFLVIQLVPSVCALWLLVLARGLPPLRQQPVLAVALLGLLNPGLSYTLSMLGLRMTTASAATLLWAAEPALIVAMAWIVLREPITIRFLAAMGAAACGVLLVSGLAGSRGLSGADAFGAALIMGGVLCCALYTVLSRQIAASIDPLSSVAIQQTVGLLWAVAIWPLGLTASFVYGEQMPSLKELLGGALSGLMYYAAAFWMYLKALQAVPATTASIFLNLTPVFGVAGAYLLLGERLAQSQWVGAAIILTSVIALLMWKADPDVQAPTG
jgi:drug/metabolite transporter (DMT)-like permease